MPHAAVIAGCVVGGVAAAIAFEVAIFRPWREQQAEADWARFKSEFDEHIKEFRRQPFFGGGRARRRDSDADAEMHRENLREIEEFEMANRQREEMDREAKEEMGQSFPSSSPEELEQFAIFRRRMAEARDRHKVDELTEDELIQRAIEETIWESREQTESDRKADEERRRRRASRREQHVATLRRRRPQEVASDDEQLGGAGLVRGYSSSQSSSSKSKHRDDQTLFDAEQEATSPHHTLGDATPSTIPDSPAWPVRSLPSASAVLVDAQDAEASSSASQSPPSLQPKPHAYRPENLSQSDLSASGHDVWAASSSGSSAGSSSRPRSERQSSGDRLSDALQGSQTWSTFTGNDEVEDPHRVSSMHSPDVRSVSPFSEIQSGGWSEVEGMSSPDGFSDLELFSASSQRNHAEDEEDSDDDQIVLGGSGSAADSGLLIENWRP